MSCVRYFNGTPHVVRYGMQDDETPRSWVLFWRNGVRFEISVLGADVAGTRFGRQWRELNRTPSPSPSPPGAGFRDWVRRWEMLCDCVISQCLDVLAEVAPDGPRRGDYWTTLREYVHTPGWEVKVVADEKVGDAVGRVVAGPKVQGAYELEPAAGDKVGIVVDGLERFDSGGLRVLDREVDWRFGPHRVETADGRRFWLKGVEHDSRWADTGEIVNDSLDRIRTYMKIQGQCQNHPAGLIDRVPRVLGYVTDETVPSEDRKYAGPEDEKDRPEPPSEPQTLVAGILLTDFPHFRNLGYLVREAKESPALVESIKRNKDAWKSQTLAVVEELHARGMACGSANKENDLPLLGQYSINVDEKEVVWLDPPVRCFMSADATPSGDSKGEFEEKKAVDLKAVKQIYEEWLPEELAKIRYPVGGLWAPN